jgi:hypothetical protein
MTDSEESTPIRRKEDTRHWFTTALLKQPQLVINAAVDVLLSTLVCLGRGWALIVQLLQLFLSIATINEVCIGIIPLAFCARAFTRRSRTLICCSGPRSGLCRGLCRGLAVIGIRLVMGSCGHFEWSLRRGFRVNRLGHLDESLLGGRGIAGRVPHAEWKCPGDGMGNGGLLRQKLRGVLGRNLMGVLGRSLRGVHSLGHLDEWLL